MRITDTVMAFPVIVILISVVAIIGPGLFNSMMAIGFIGWTGIARLTRGQILSVREMDFVLAAQSVGAPRIRILARHVLPSIIAPVTVAASFGMAGAILTEAALSFLGLGVQIPIPSWGNMLNQAQSIEIIEKYVWLWIPARVAHQRDGVVREFHRRWTAGCAGPAHDHGLTMPPQAARSGPVVPRGPVAQDRRRDRRNECP